MKRHIPATPKTHIPPTEAVHTRGETRAADRRLPAYKRKNALIKVVDKV